MSAASPWRPVDLVCAGYFALVGAAVVAFRGHVASWPADAGVHLLWVAAIAALAYGAAARPRHPLLAALRDLYPIACYAYGWIEMGHLLPMVTGAYRGTAFLEAADRALFGALPAQLPQLYRPWLDEVACAFYSGYYGLPLIAVWLSLRGRREELAAVLGTVTLTYFVNYVLFYALPALDPRSAAALAGGAGGAMGAASGVASAAGGVAGAARGAAAGAAPGDYTGFLFGAITRAFERGGGISGGCFPSSHVSGTVAWSAAVWRRSPRLGRALAVLAAGIAVATVYLHYHWAVDPLAGAALGLACAWLARRWVAREPAVRPGA
ncbi:MAG TPA: phosphatase PAP2 family protein [Candidatus Saccharimonadales bacterium]|nr:phosphatase PAP2 family protein [Candidatus Saccharimonadales bacterium]